MRMYVCLLLLSKALARKSTVVISWLSYECFIDTNCSVQQRKNCNHLHLSLRFATTKRRRYPIVCSHTDFLRQKNKKNTAQMLILTSCAAPTYLNMFLLENENSVIAPETIVGCYVTICLHDVRLELCQSTNRYVAELFANSDSPQRRLSNRLEHSSREFRLAVKLGVVSGYVFDSKHFIRNICILIIKWSTNIPMVNVVIFKSMCYVSVIKRWLFL